MRPEERDPAYLWDMIEAAQAVVEFTSVQHPRHYDRSGCVQASLRCPTALTIRC